MGIVLFKDLTATYLREFRMTLNLDCPCGSGRQYSDCCEPYILDTQNAPTAEALMRSRYTAYTFGNIQYILQTWDPKYTQSLNAKELEKWANQCDWKSLEIIDKVKGRENDDTGIVEFAAKYELGGRLQKIHERSQFKKVNGKWLYTIGEHFQKKQKVGRNDPCPCGSGKKYKKCCG